MKSPLSAPLQLRHPLVVIDDGHADQHALSLAIVAAHVHHGRVSIIAVAPVHRPTWDIYDPGLQQEIDDEVAALLRGAAACVPHELSVTTVLRHGNLGREVVRAAAALQCDAILLGGRRTGVFRAVGRKAYRYVLRHADVPVIVAQAPPQLDPAAAPAPRRLRPVPGEA
jgi:nucleotide-binding universal stress UspA family protein